MKQMQNRVRIDFAAALRNIVGGFLIAAAAVWLAGAVLLTSPTIFEYDRELDFANRAAGYGKQQRGENWVNFRIGALGLEETEARKLADGRRKVLIHGDSYVEAVMIPPEERMQNLFSSRSFSALGIGYSGAGAPEFAYLMSRFPKKIPGVAAQVIFTADSYDFRFVDPEACDGTRRGGLGVRASSAADVISYRSRAFAVRAVMRRIRLLKLDFVGNRWFRRGGAGETVLPVSNVSGVVSALTATARRSGVPLVLIVYAPRLPGIRDGKVCFDDPDQSYAAELEAACGRNGIGFVNLGPDFAAYFRRSGKFVSGFFNTPPGMGHLNSAGHRIAAEAISRYFAGEK